MGTDQRLPVGFDSVTTKRRRRPGAGASTAIEEYRAQAMLLALFEVHGVEPCPGAIFVGRGV